MTIIVNLYVGPCKFHYIQKVEIVRIFYKDFLQGWQDFSYDTCGNSMEICLCDGRLQSYLQEGVYSILTMYNI